MQFTKILALLATAAAVVAQHDYGLHQLDERELRARAMEELYARDMEAEDLWARDGLDHYGEVWD